MRVRLNATTLVGCLRALSLLLSLSLTVCAQAWLPLKDEGRVTFSYQNVRVRDHLDYTGKRFDAGPIRTHSQVLFLEYGLTSNLALDADITHVSSKYEGFVGPVLHGPVDTGDYHPTFQDLRIGLRYNAYNRAVTVTPFVGVVVPTHRYETAGHSAVGRDLRELQMGVNVGRDLEGILSRSYVHGRYLFAVVQGVEEFNLNRSNADWEIGHVATARLSLRFTGAWQRTYDGIDIPRDRDHPHFHDLHDRASRSNFIRLGGGASFRLGKTLDLHADYTGTVHGMNTHAANGISLGISWRFSSGLKIGQLSGANAPARLSGVTGRL